jgi:Lipid A 3-O-deacylase (PagL)
VFLEAWDRNESTEWLTGVMVGVDRRVWRGLAIRGEALVQRVFQEGENAWLGGFTIGTRARWRRRTWSHVADIAVGVSDASHPLPPRGTSFNYLALIGAGIQRPLGRLSATVTGRWLHASNAGREGSHRNPDIQSLGLVFSVGW